MTWKKNRPAGVCEAWRLLVGGSFDARTGLVSAQALFRDRDPCPGHGLIVEHSKFEDSSVAESLGIRKRAIERGNLLVFRIEERGFR